VGAKEDPKQFQAAFRFSERGALISRISRQRYS
jgi:hypothetical protein